MTEEEARSWVEERFGAAACVTLDHIGALVRDEATRQNLIAPSTLDQMWSRHLTDSAQLVPLAQEREGSWIDIGTGAGFPGLVVAALFAGPVTLVEPRAKRANFLSDVVSALGLHATVIQRKVEAVPPQTAAVISARAVASSDALLTMSSHLRDPGTMYVLPRGQAGIAEVEELRRDWSGMFHVEHSVTDDRSIIITATGVAGRCSVSR